MLRASFVPPKPIRDLRLLTCYRRTQISERKREAQPLHKALEDTGINLDCVATDTLGESARPRRQTVMSVTPHHTQNIGQDPSVAVIFQGL